MVTCGPLILIFFFISFFAFLLPFFNISASTSISNATSEAFFPKEKISFSLFPS